jgi:hypothetical protein
VIDFGTPAHIGSHAQAWRCNRAAALRRHKIALDPVIADWIVHVPGLHQAFHTIHIALQHLRPLHIGDRITRAVPGATHELWITALDPAHDHAATVQGAGHPHRVAYLAQLFAAQIVASDDPAAASRIAATIDLITTGDLNPLDQPQWIALFGDAMFEKAAA